MRTQIFTTLVLLGLFNSAGAVRVLKEVERPFEIAVGQLTLPKDTGGSLTLRGCDACRIGSYRLQGTTVFVLDGRQIPYADFSHAVDALRGSAAGEATVVSVFVDRDTERVTRVSVHRPRR
jgi:hypothetical protein